MKGSSLTPLIFIRMDGEFTCFLSCLPATSCQLFQNRCRVKESLLIGERSTEIDDSLSYNFLTD